MLFLSFFVIIASLFYGEYNFDPHHWGLMLSNAVDLSRGRIPYKEIFIQYGFLTALIEYLFFLVSGNILSIVFGIGLFYAAGLVGIYFLTMHLSSKRGVALFAFVSAFLIHPIAIYPWPNYIAFPFISFGCLAVLKGRRDWRIGFVGGILFGCAVLAREGYFIPLVISLSVWFALALALERSNAGVRAAPLGGMALMIGLFVLYLWRGGMLQYWQQIAIELPKLYAAFFFHDGLIAAVISLFNDIFRFSLSQHARQTFFALIVLSAAWFWFDAFRQRLKGRSDHDLLFVALTACLLLSSAVHLHDIFRLATSVSIGVGLTYILAERLGVSGLLFIASSVGLIAGAFGDDSGIYFFPNKAQREAASTNNSIGLFVGQHWRSEVFDYYRWFAEDMRVLEKRSCGLRYFRNETRDAFLATLSPFRQYQLMPFGKGMLNVPIDDWNRRLRPDYDIPERLRARDVVIFASSIRPGSQDPVLPAGYMIFDQRFGLERGVQPDEDVTYVIVPAECGKRN